MLDEVAERAPDPVLAVGDDGGVGDRDVERMAEQRRDREPVGEATDHRRLRRGPDVAEPGMLRLQDEGHQEHGAHDDEQARRPALHAVELELLRLRVGDLGDRHGTGLRGGHGGKR